MKNHVGGDTFVESTQPVATGKRIILFALPLQGHLGPMLHLANILHAQGFKITIIHIESFNAPNHSDYPQFTFKPIDASLYKLANYTDELDPSSFLKFLNEHCAKPYRDCLNDMLAEPNEPPIACLITDGEYYFAQEVADSFKIPRLVTWFCNIVVLLVYNDFSFFCEKGYFSLTTKDSIYEEPLQKYPHLKVKDVVKITTNPDGMARVLAEVVKQVKKSSGIIWNSFKEAEEDTLQILSHDFPIPRFTLGPIQKYLAPSTSKNALEQDRTFFSWLDAQPPKSVIYVSFGSTASISESEFQEVAYGLANTGFSFLWVVRPDVVKGSEWLKSLPEKFLEEVGDRGRIVKWCPQKEVLAHKATGCFWTHSGWNSTLESVCEGVPMICSPCEVGQALVARYVSDVWKIGIFLEDGFQREAIKKTVKRIMVEKEGEEIRERIHLFKEEVNTSFKEGGLSHQTIKSLIHYISSL